jgi:hypothetical protein
VITEKTVRQIAGPFKRSSALPDPFSQLERFSLCSQSRAIFLCSLSSVNLILLNPLFLAHLAKSGFDCFFIAPLALCLDNDYSYIGALLISFIRQLSVTPNASLSLLWLLERHDLTALFATPNVAFCPSFSTQSPIPAQAGVPLLYSRCFYYHYSIRILVSMPRFY